MPVLLVLAVVAGLATVLVPVRPLPVWSATLLVLLSVGAVAWAGVTHSEQVLPRRDSGSYLQSAIQLASGHERPIAVSPGSVGGAEVLAIDGITLGSPAFYATGSPQEPSIQPQFPIGASAWYSVAWWVGGAAATVWAAALLFGMTVLGVGLLASSVVGPRWGPLAALGTALLFPLVHVARSTYSEPVALPVLAAGLVTMVLAARSAALPDVVVARRAAVVAGVLMGGAIAIRVDALREVVLVVPVVVLAALQRQAPCTRARGLHRCLCRGRLRCHLADLERVPRQHRRLAASPRGPGARRLPARRRPAGHRASRGLDAGLFQAWLPRVLAAGFVVVGLVWPAARGGRSSASRPPIPGPVWWRGSRPGRDFPSTAAARMRSRAWCGCPGGSVRSRSASPWSPPRCWPTAPASAWVDGRELPGWAGPAIVGIGSTLLTLYRPGITPDHPWADRRLVIALPTVVLLTVACAAVVSRWSTRRLPYAVNVAVSVGIAAALLVPTALATRPHADERVEKGEWAAVDDVCSQLRPGDVALMVDSRAANEWPQVLRGYCGVGALSTTSALRGDPTRLAAAVEQIRSAVDARGGHLVLVAADSTEALTRLGLKTAVVAVDTRVDEDARLLEQRPDSLVQLPIQVWLGRVG